MDRYCNNFSKREEKINVAVCGPYWMHGGAEKQFRMLIKTLLDSGRYKVDVYLLSSCDQGEGWTENEYKNGNLSFHNHNIDPLNDNNFKVFIYSLKILIKLIRKKHDVIYFYSLYFLPNVILPLLKQNVKMIYSERILSDRVQRMRWFYKLFSKFDVFVVNSNASLKYFSKFLNNVVKIDNYVLPINNDMDLKRSVKKIAIVSRLSPEKNIDYVLKNIGNDEWKINIYSSGEAVDYSRYLRKQYSDLSNVRFYRAKPIESIYAENDCIVHPSLFEGTPNVVIEAMASNFPCFVSNIPQHKDIGIDSRCIFNIGEGDSLTKTLKNWNSMTAIDRQSIINTNKLKTECFSLSNFRKRITDLFS